jgi:hypothetical protein
LPRNVAIANQNLPHTHRQQKLLCVYIKGLDAALKLGIEYEDAARQIAYAMRRRIQQGAL